MSRAPSDSDFTVEVEGVGRFTFGRRRMRDEVAIQVEYARLIDGVEPTVWLQTVCGWISVLSVLTVRAPAGWNIDELDPLDPVTYEQMGKVFDALSDKERSFRGNKTVQSEG